MAGLMKAAVISLFPEMFASIREYGVSGRAMSQGLLELEIFNPREYTEDVHRNVDDRPYGGGPGMVMQIAPLLAAVAAAKAWIGSESSTDPIPVIYLSPQGQTLQQAAVAEMAQRSNLILLAGRYEGIDERLMELVVTEEWSIGDYVLSGGELPAMVLLDAITRLLPGALGHSESAEQDSFTEGLLDCPHYTRPEDYEGLKVPEVLLSGDHARIRRWRLQQALGRTWQRRPDLLAQRQLSSEEEKLLQEFKAETPAGDSDD